MNLAPPGPVLDAAARRYHSACQAHVLATADLARARTLPEIAHASAALIERAREWSAAAADLRPLLAVQDACRDENRRTNQARRCGTIGGR